MANSSADPANYQKYGVPLYGAAWIPLQAVRSAHVSEQQTEDDRKIEADDAVAENKSVMAPEVSNTQSYLVFAGGGGEGRSGIPNAIILAHFDVVSNALSDQPVVKLGTGSDLPYRIATHPGGDGLICAMPNGCRLFEWGRVRSTEVLNLGVKASKKVLTQLEDIGQQKALMFNQDGSVLAVGGEDGNLRVFKWPSMEIILNEAHAAGKDLDFSPDGKFFASLGDKGICRVWDLNSSMIVASLSKENDEIFGFCRFSQMPNKNQVLYVTAMTGQGGRIVKWDSTSWKRIASKKVVRDPISAFNVSADGKLLAIGTVQGDILILHSTSMRVQRMVKKAHLVIVTALTFSHDSRTLASVSLDSSARVTIIEDKKDNAGYGFWAFVFIILLAIVAYYLKNQGILIY